MVFCDADSDSETQTERQQWLLGNNGYSSVNNTAFQHSDKKQFPLSQAGMPSMHQYSRHVITRRSHFRFTIRLIPAWIKLLLLMMTNKQNTLFSWLCICFIQYCCYRLYCVIGLFHEEEKGTVLMNVCSSEWPLLLLSNVCFLKISLLLLVLCFEIQLGEGCCIVKWFT